MTDLPTTPDVLFVPDFLTHSEADSYYDRLKSELEFAPDRMRFGGQVIETKRKFSFHGVHDYAYSGEVRTPKVLTPVLSELKAKIESAYPYDFNAVLCNYYDESSVMMGYHADKEAELGDKPVIISLNFGQTRRFSFRYRRDIGDIPTTHRVIDFELAHGSLLVMGPECQKYFEHSLLKQDKAQGKKVVNTSVRQYTDRINLTYRKVLDVSLHRKNSPRVDDLNTARTDTTPTHPDFLVRPSSAFTFKFK